MAKEKKDNRVEVFITRSPKGYAYSAGEVVKVSSGIAEKLKDLDCARDPKQTLPDDFPHREDLIAGGYETVESIEAADDLTKVKNIGEAGEKEIAEYLSKK